MKLYEISEQFLALQKMFDDCEIDSATLADTLAGIELDFESKARNCMMIKQSLTHDSLAIGSEIDRLKLLQKQVDNNAESMIEYIKLNMIGIGKDKLDLGIFKLTLKQPSKVVSVIDESKIPDKFFKVIPESKQLDKNELKKALDSEQIEGAQLIDGKRALLIK